MFRRLVILQIDFLFTKCSVFRSVLKTGKFSKSNFFFHSRSVQCRSVPETGKFRRSDFFYSRSLTLRELGVIVFSRVACLLLFLLKFEFDLDLL